MGKYTVVLSLGLAFLVSVTADADVLKLANGGDLKGSVHQVTFLSGGKQTVYASERLERLWVSEVGKDRLTLKDGTSLEGELISLKFRSVGGLLTFRRKEVKAVELGDTALDQVRKEFAARKAKVKPDDAGGLLELAEWARAKGLKPEALELARTCLEAAKGDVADKAHTFLDHVRYKGEWMTRLEMLKRKQAEAGTEDNKDGKDGKENPPDKKKLTPEQIAAIKEAHAKNKELLKVYGDRVVAMRNDEYGKAKDRFGNDYNEVTNDLKRLKATIEKKEAYRKTVRKTYEDRYGGDYNPSFNDGLEKDEEEYDRLRHRRAALARKMRQVKTQIDKHAGERKQRVQLVHDQCQYALQLGRVVGEEQMKRAYEAALALE